MPLIDPQLLAARARNLGGLNGLSRVIVTLAPPQATLDVEFFNAQQVADLVSDPRPPNAVFPISGGSRVPAGVSAGFVKVTSIAVLGASSLRLIVEPIGDYSRYTLSVDAPFIDPLFSFLEFRFRPGCFSGACAPVPDGLRREEPEIDYLAKDYASFRHTLLTALAQRMPGWQPTSEASLDVVLVDLLAASADELSDYQDRVMNEAFFPRARKRVSLVRHAQLVDYQPNPGAQAEGVVAVRIAAPHSTMLDRSVALAVSSSTGPFFSVTEPTFVVHHGNELGLYTWQGARPGLLAGERTADVTLADPSPAAASELATAILDGRITRLLLQHGRDPARRQIVRLERAAEALSDPLTNDPFVRVRWVEEDALRADYRFVEPDPTTGVLVSGRFFLCANLVSVAHGAWQERTFRFASAIPFAPGEAPLELVRGFTVCRLPNDQELAYRPLSLGSAHSTAEVIIRPALGADRSASEVTSLIHSRSGDDHYVVDTDERRQSLLRFGNGVNGRGLSDGDSVIVRYQAGRSEDGNVGPDSIVTFAGASWPDVQAVWNPLATVGGVAPEPPGRILRSAPEAFRSVQQRAITLTDYARRAEEVPGVARAVARYRWTGSYRTVRVAVDPSGTRALDEALRARVSEHLESLRMAGEDLEIRGPRYVPLLVQIALCVAGHAWPDDLRDALEAEMSGRILGDGRLGFFHPDAWTFGDELHESQIVGRLSAIEGVEHVISVSVRRLDAPDRALRSPLLVDLDEVLEAPSDPDHRERGYVSFDLRGGRG